MNHNLEKNKENAIAFYRTAYLGEPAKAVELYVGDDYIQHNPLVGNGNNSLLRTLMRCKGITQIKASSLLELSQKEIWSLCIRIKPGRVATST